MATERDLNDLPGSGLRLRTTAIVIYATLALLALTIPQSMVNRLNDFSPNAARDAALTLAQAIADASHRIGADWPFQAGRRLFLSVTGKQDD